MPDSHAIDPAAELESVLGSLIETHEQMVAIAIDHRAAISRADAAGVQACVGQQAVLSARVAELETQRRSLAAAIAPAMAGSPTITTIARALPEPARGRVLGAASRLREVLLRLQNENRILRSATQTLLTHMDGLIQQVARALSQARLYGPRGRIDTGGTAPLQACAIDLTH